MAASFQTSLPSTTSWSFETIFKFDFSPISERISSIASRCFECLKSLWDRAATAVSSFFTRAPVSPVHVGNGDSPSPATGLQGTVHSVGTSSGSRAPDHDAIGSSD